MRNYFKRRELDGDEERERTKRSLVLTTVPRLLQLDLKQISDDDKKAFFGGAMELTNGSDLAKLSTKAQYRHNWKKAVERSEQLKNLSGGARKRNALQTKR